MVMDCWKHFHLSILEIHYRKTEKFINIQHSGMMFGVCAGSGFIFIFEFVFLNRHFCHTENCRTKALVPSSVV